MVRATWIMGLLFVLAAISSPANAGEVINGIAAVVDDQAVTLFDVETMAAPIIAQYQTQNPNAMPADRAKKIGEIRQQILQGMIEQKLIESEVKRLSIEVSDTEIDEYEGRIKQANNYTDETLRLALQRQGITYNEFRERLKKEIMREQYVSFRMRDKLRVRDEDIQAYYDLHKEEFSAEPVVKIAEIRFNAPPDTTEADLQPVFAKANQLYERLQAGEDFAALARTNSQGSTAADGGLLGEYKIDSELSAVYRKAIFNLQPGQYSTIYRDRNGFVILKLLEKKTSNVLALDAVRNKIEMILRKKQADQEMDRLAAELRKKSYVDIRMNFGQ